MDSIDQFAAAIERGALSELRALVADDPTLPKTAVPGLAPWVYMASSRDAPEVIAFLAENGASINAHRSKRLDKNAIACASRNGLLKNLKVLIRVGGEMDTTTVTSNPLIAAITGQSSESVQILLDAGVDSTVRYDGYPGPYMDALAFALERGEREIARQIALHQADGDRIEAQRRLDEAYEVSKLNNPGAKSYPERPMA